MAENVPAAEVVAVATWAPLKSTATVSLPPNPAPVTVTVEVGGPELGFKVMLVVTAAAGAADKPTARTTPTAAAASTRGPQRQRENRAAKTLTEPMACWSVRTGPPPPPQEARNPRRPVTGTAGPLASTKQPQVGAGAPLAALSVTASQPQGNRGVSARRLHRSAAHSMIKRGARSVGPNLAGPDRPGHPGVSRPVRRHRVRSLARHRSRSTRYNTARAAAPGAALRGH